MAPPLFNSATSRSGPADVNGTSSHRPDISVNIQNCSAYTRTCYLATDHLNDRYQAAEHSFGVALASSRKVARPCIPAGMRIYAVGDVHGRADLLAPLLARIDADLSAHPIARPCQVFLGDYIDRGPHSRQVIDLLIARRRRHQMLFLKGNHEDFALEFLSDPTKLSEWKQVGGVSTLLIIWRQNCRPHRPSGRRRSRDRVSSGLA